MPARPRCARYFNNPSETAMPLERETNRKKRSHDARSMLFMLRIGAQHAMQKEVEVQRPTLSERIEKVIRLPLVVDFMRSSTCAVKRPAVLLRVHCRKKGSQNGHHLELFAHIVDLWRAILGYVSVLA